MDTGAALVGHSALRFPFSNDRQVVPLVLTYTNTYNCHTNYVQANRVPRLININNKFYYK